MPFFRDTQGIGRGEVAESRMDLPFVAIFMAFCAVVVLIVHIYAHNNTITLALAVSMIVFGVTVVRVDMGIIILIFAMLLSPEVDFGEGHSRGVHGFSIRYDDILIGVIFLGVLVKLAFEGRQSFWRPSPVNAGILAYFSICLVSTLLALQRNLPAWDPKLAMFTLLKMTEFYMVYFMVGNAVRHLGDVRKFLWYFLLVAFIVCVTCSVTVGSVDRVGTPFQKHGTEPNTLGGYLTLVMIISMALMTQTKKFTQKALFFLLFCAAFFPFLFTLSRASYFALIVGMIALGILTRKWYLLAAIALVLILSPMIMPDTVKDRVNYTFQRGTGEQVIIHGQDTGLQVDKSTYERVYVWNKVWFLLHIVPWFGGGVAWEQVLDSQYARVIMETGLFGLAAFLFMQFRILRTCREASRWTRDWIGRGLALGTTAATIAMMVHSFGTISFVIIRIMEPFWFLVALTVVVRLIAIQDHTQRALTAKKQRLHADERPVSDDETTKTIIARPAVASR